MASTRSKLLIATLSVALSPWCPVNCVLADLLVSSNRTNSVLRYNEVTGAFQSALVPAGVGGLSGPGGLAIGPDGGLYVASNTAALRLIHTMANAAVVVRSVSTTLRQLPFEFSVALSRQGSFPPPPNLFTLIALLLAKTIALGCVTCLLACQVTNTSPSPRLDSKHAE